MMSSTFSGRPLAGGLSCQRMFGASVNSSSVGAGVSHFAARSGSSSLVLELARIRLEYTIPRMLTSVVGITCGSKPRRKLLLTVRTPPRLGVPALAAAGAAVFRLLPQPSTARPRAPRLPLCRSERRLKELALARLPISGRAMIHPPSSLRPPPAVRAENLFPGST